MNEHSFGVLELDKVRQALLDRATWPGGQRRVRSWQPTPDTSRASQRRVRISEIRRILEDSDLPIHGLGDLRETLKRAETPGAVLTGEAIAPVAKSLGVTRGLVRYLFERRELLPHLSEIAGRLDDLGSLRADIERQIDPSGEILDSATPALRRVRREQETVRQRVLAALNRVVRSVGPQGSEPVITVRNDRYVIGVHLEQSSKLNGIIHGRSGSGASVYLEPSTVVSLNNELAELRSAEQEEIRRILAQLTEQIRVAVPVLRENEDVLSELDATYAAGRWSRDLDARPAEVSSDGAIEIRQGRHPLLETANRSTGLPTIPLDLELGGERARILVVTGPNTGGKTVALKTTGLFALMNQMGLHLPAAEGTRLPWLDAVYADIGDEQSIEASLSTFSSHMAHIKEVLENADDRTLVLLDEVGVGTDPDEGSALGKAILSELAFASAFTIVTTHYGSLKVFAHEQDSMENASLEFDRDTLSPTYRFLQGVPGSSEAIAIAHRLGLPSHVLSRAREELGEDKQAVENLLRDLRDRRRQLLEDQEALDEERTTLAALQAETQERLSTWRATQGEKKREALAEARSLVERARSELDDIIKTARKGPAGKDADRARSRLGELGKSLEKQLAESAPESQAPRRPAEPHELVEGAEVFVPSMGLHGVLLGGPTSRGKVPVSIGALRMDVAVDAIEIKTAPNGSKASSSNKRARAAAVQTPEVAAKIEIDLRGRTVDDAVTEVDHALDDLTVAGGTYLRIIHGKGTGALRVAVGERLSNDGRVESYRLGEPAEGGDGVTIAVLK